MFVQVAVLAVVLALSPAVPVQGRTIHCQKYLTDCINNHDATVLDKLANYDYPGVCTMVCQHIGKPFGYTTPNRPSTGGALSKTAQCYAGAINQTFCNNTGDINGIHQLNATDRQFEHTYCLNGRPVTCLTELKKCHDQYKHDVTSQMCRAANTATTCIQPLQDLTRCPNNLQGEVSSFEHDISEEFSLANCTMHNPNASRCAKDAGTCLKPIENQLKANQELYDFDGVCQGLPKARKCFDDLKADHNCAADTGELQINEDILNNKWSAYCNNDGTPKACLQQLTNCTSEYVEITSLSQYKTDPLYVCEGTQRLVNCLNNVNADLNSCPAVSKVRGIANSHHLQAQLRNNCTSIITPCTSTASKCLVTQDLKLSQSGELGKFTTACQNVVDLRKCVDEPLNEQSCNNNSFLQAERKYATNVSNTICSDHDHPPPCLLQAQNCSVAFDNALKNLTQVCSAQVQLVKCLGKIHCQSSALQQFVTRTRQKDRKDECGGGAATLYVSLTLLVAAVLRQWL